VPWLDVIILICAVVMAAIMAIGGSINAYGFVHSCALEQARVPASLPGPVTFCNDGADQYRATTGPASN
jgi:hypothetical protein